MILEDRIILRTDPSFLPKVVSTFHGTQDIALLTFSSSSVTDEEGSLSLLDVKRSLLCYLDFSAEVQKKRAHFMEAERQLRIHNYSYVMLFPARLRVAGEERISLTRRRPS